METIRFDELNLDPRILRAVTDMGFEAASPIQAQAIPVEMEGHDMRSGIPKAAVLPVPVCAWPIMSWPSISTGK